jgi:hypothetical protein
MAASMDDHGFSDDVLWEIAQAGYAMAFRARETPWEEESSPHQYCWYLGAVHAVSGEATPESLRVAIQPGLYLRPWRSLSILDIQQYRNIYGAMLSTARRIAARQRAAA